MKRNQLSKGGPGGGPSSKALGVTTYFTGAKPATKISPRGVSQFGESIGNHATDGGGKVLRGGVEATRVGMMPAGGPGGVPLGNEVALNVGGGGPGTGRTLFWSVWDAIAIRPCGRQASTCGQGHPARVRP
jgi:hypothetical protein